jgi:hypothetical protein
LGISMCAFALRCHLTCPCRDESGDPLFIDLSREGRSLWRPPYFRDTQVKPALNHADNWGSLMASHDWVIR